MYSEGHVWANSVNPDQTTHSTAQFAQGLHRLSFCHKMLDTMYSPKLSNRFAQILGAVLCLNI